MAIGVVYVSRMSRMNICNIFIKDKSCPKGGLTILFFHYALNLIKLEHAFTTDTSYINFTRM